MSGRDGFASRVIISSRQMTSEATDDPPGLSTRITIARIDSSSRICRICSTIVSEPTTAPLTGSYALLPDAMIPEAWSTATRAVGRMPDGLRRDALIQRSVDRAVLAVRLASGRQLDRRADQDRPDRRRGPRAARLRAETALHPAARVPASTLLRLPSAMPCTSCS